MSGSTCSTTGGRWKRTYPGAGCLKLASWRRAPKMSRRLSSLISSQTSNWIKTRTEPCKALFWAVDGAWVEAVTDFGATVVGFASSIGSGFLLCYGGRKPLRGGLVSCLLSQKRGWMGSWLLTSFFTVV